MPKKLILAALALALAGPLHAADKSTVKKPVRKQSTETSTYGPEDLLARTVFQSLLADLALQRGDTELGVTAWADLARRTRDPAVIARATEVAGATKQYDLALELTRLWLQVAPDSTQARQTESSLLLLSNRIDDLAPQLAKLLEQDKASLPGNLMHLNRMLSRHPDKKAVQRLIDRVAEPYLELPEAHFAMGLAASNADDLMRAQSEFARALQLRPDWEVAALARAQLLARQSHASAIESLREFVAANPGARDARLTLARLLISDQKYDEARVEFDRLLKEHPDNPDVIYPVAMLALQQGDAATGRTLLEKLLKSDFPDKSTVHFFLGQLDEEQKKPEAALAHFRLVTTGDQYIAARARAAQILLQQGKPDEARELLHATRGGNATEQSQLAIAEAQLLREAGRRDDGYAVLEAALAKYPDNPELLYETALTAERQGKPEVMEKHLRQLLKLKPDHAHALNALGYSLAERNIRLAEAQDLITRALALAPQDPFIMDSMGWVQFRQGKLPEALKTLETAYGIKADPEIAAHLGEVLWTMGRKDDAARLLKEAAKKYPDSDVLAGAVKKIRPLRLLAAALLACSVLAGCASTPSGTPAPRDQVRDFTLDARFALRVSLPERPAESSGGRLAWEHRNGNDRILVSNPLGVGLAEIETSPTLSRLHTADGQTRESADADALMEEITGQALPIRQLPDWLLGRAKRPGNLKNDGNGRPLRLAEAGWQIDYAYDDDAPDALPSGVTLRRTSEIELRLRIEEWKTAP